jgi:hypothetical protein
MKYTLPPRFNLARAQELATLVNAVQGAAWVIPEGYTLAKSLSAKETWKGFGHVANLIPEVSHALPFGFVATKGTDLYVIIRGTRTPLEWFDDFTAFLVNFAPNGQPWGKIARGFSLLYNQGWTADRCCAFSNRHGARITEQRLTPRAPPGRGVCSESPHSTAASACPAYIRLL